MPAKGEIKFGIVLAPSYHWTELLDQALEVEKLGFDYLWIPDHFVNPHNSSANWFEGWSLLAALAARTKRLRIGTLVSSMTLRNPALLVRQAITLDHISQGRMELGVGSAGTSYCHTMTGIPQWSKGERSARYREWIEIIAQMLVQEETTYNGTYFQIEEAVIRPKAVQQPSVPLHIAAHGPKSLRLAARFGDGWNSFYPGVELTPKDASTTVAGWVNRLEDEAAAAGRDPHLVRRLFRFGWTTDKPFASSEAFNDAVGRYFEAGIREFAFFYLPGFDLWEHQCISTPEWLEKVSGEVIPKLRKQMDGGF